MAQNTFEVGHRHVAPTISEQLWQFFEADKLLKVLAAPSLRLLR